MKEKLPKVRKGNIQVWENGISLKIGIICNWTLAFDLVGKEIRDWSWLNMMLRTDEQVGIVNIYCLTNLVVTAVIMI